MAAPTLPPLDDYSRLMPTISAWERGQAEFLGALLLRLLAPRSVIDLGCGPGTYLLRFKRAGCMVRGVDADVAAGVELSQFEFMRGDLRLPFHFNQSTALEFAYDLCLCIETAEHLQPEFADVLVDTCCRAAPVVFWSAAHKGQGGQNHYNEHSPGFWLAKFQARGYGPHPLNDEIKREIAANDECRKVQWLIPNAFLVSKSAA